jgi:hypothetical protein
LGRIPGSGDAAERRRNFVLGEFLRGAHWTFPDGWRGEYDWVLLTVRIHDFVMQFGPVTRHMKELACVAMHADFIHITGKPAPGIVLEVAVG